MKWNTTLLGLIALWAELGDAAATWPAAIDELEDVMFLQTGHNARGLRSHVTPCTYSEFGAGRQTAAEWLRLGFHDMATANAYATPPSGGIDASIAFELNNGENVGTGFASSLTTLGTYMNKQLPMSDLIALATYASVRACGGPSIPMRGGRVDATQDGPTGVPQTNDGGPVFRSRFFRMGFSQTDMIQMTVCGHTIGGVHSANFPDIVPPGTAPDDYALLDGTKVFDNAIVTQYLVGPTVDPLVIGPVRGKRSDLAVFSIDQNATIQTMQDATAFNTICQSILQRMIEVKPGPVTLSDIIVPYEVKPSGVQLTLLDGGSQVKFSGEIRVRTTSAAVSGVQIVYKTRSGGAGGTITGTASGTANGFDDSFAFYSFSANLPSTTSISSFTVVVTGASGTTTYDNNGSGFPVQDSVIFQAPQSCVTGGSMTVVAAVRSGVGAPSLIVTQKSARTDGVPMPILGDSTVAMTQGNTVGAYNLYSATVSIGSAGATTFSVTSGALSDSFKQASILGATCAPLSGGASSSTTTTTASSVPPSSSTTTTSSNVPPSSSTTTSSSPSPTTTSVSQTTTSSSVISSTTSSSNSPSPTTTSTRPPSSSSTTTSVQSTTTSAQPTTSSPSSSTTSQSPTTTSTSHTTSVSTSSSSQTTTSQSQTTSSSSTTTSSSSPIPSSSTTTSRAPSSSTTTTQVSTTLSSSTTSTTPTPSHPATVGAYTFQGCYNEIPNARALSEARHDDPQMTTEKCAASCSDYTYFGIEYGQECYCGNTLSPLSTQSTLTDCYFICPGNSLEYCGAGNRIELYKRPATSTTTTRASTTSSHSATPTATIVPYSGTYNYYGCWTEPQSGVRALSAAYYPSNVQTIAQCVESCKDYKYAGAEYSAECYCANEFTTGSVLAPNSDCDMTCAGDTGTWCGGPNRLNVYINNGTLYNPDGCWTDSQTDRALTGAYHVANDMSIEKCNRLCDGYSIFGVEYGSECFCGNSVTASSTKTDISDCSSNCSGNSAEKCGAGNRINLYRLATTTPTPTPANKPTIGSYKYLGCRTEADNYVRALSSGSFYNTTSMTNEYCSQRCAGFKYFGTEYASECYCGNSFNTGSVEAPDSDCNFKCPGAADEFCGAGNRLTVYETS